jgi:hypothetical protein
MVANTALKKMLKSGHFSICTIDDILKLTGSVPRGQDYNLLHALHCVDYKDMPPELLRGLPLLLQRVLGSERLDFDYAVFRPNLTVAA